VGKISVDPLDELYGQVFRLALGVAPSTYDQVIADIQFFQSLQLPYSGRQSFQSIGS